jgi:hypothetical protein
MSSLAKNFLLSHLLLTIFNFLLNCVLFFPHICAGLSTSICRVVMMARKINDTPSIFFLLSLLTFFTFNRSSYSKYLFKYVIL